MKEWDLGDCKAVKTPGVVDDTNEEDEERLMEQEGNEHKRPSIPHSMVKDV